MERGPMEDGRPRRQSLKSRRPNWTDKLRENCLKRVQADRTRLFWKMRSTSGMDTCLLSTSAMDTSLLNHKKVVESTFRDIMCSELKRINSSVSPSVNQVVDDDLWEYDGPQAASQLTETECEEILLQMQTKFYEDLRLQPTDTGEDDSWSTGEEEEDILAQLALEHLCLNDQKVWCPVCIRGELKQDCHLIYCSGCKLQLERGEEVNLELLQVRLVAVNTEHLDRGCKLAPQFCTETRFNLTALYIKCDACNTFEIVI